MYRYVHLQQQQKKTYLKSKDTYDISLILKDRYWLSQSKKTIHIPMLWLYLYLLLIIYLAYQPIERTWSCIHVWKEEKEIININVIYRLQHRKFNIACLRILGRIGVINCFLIKKNVLDISYSNDKFSNILALKIDNFSFIFIQNVSSKGD